MLKKTLYSKTDEFQILFTVPHGAGHENFFSRHPKLLRGLLASLDASCLEVYLEIERDFASSELAHASAKKIFEACDRCGVLVVEVDYPRGILDGGRQASHCLREILSHSLREEHGDELVALHNQCLSEIREQLKIVKASNGIVLDLHTMASYSPLISPVLGSSARDLEAYVEAYLNASRPHKALKRHVDIISCDGYGAVLADPELRQIFVEGLSSEYTIAENEPYAALPPFLMNELMRNAKGLAIDFPKDCFSVQAADSSFLANLDFCEKKTKHCAGLIARLVIQFFSLRL